MLGIQINIINKTLPDLHCFACPTFFSLLVCENGFFFFFVLFSVVFVRFVELHLCSKNLALHNILMFLLIITICKFGLKTAFNLVITVIVKETCQMELFRLFITASIPVLKVLLVTALGSYLALDRVNILGAETRKHLNTVSSTLL